MKNISGKAASAIREIFGTDKIPIGMIHWPAFPGSPCYQGASMESVYDATIEEIEEIGSGSHLPLLVGSGVDKDNAAEIFKRTNGMIVASSLKQGGVWWNPLDPERVRAFRAAVEPALED
jgi:predicted TIM-barrel enzyme